MSSTSGLAGRRVVGRGADRGFTLIELMVVMSLIVVLASVGLTVYANSVTRAKEAVLKEDLFRMRDAIDQYFADKNRYPTSLEELVSEKYLRAIPIDPMTNSADTWQTVLAEPEPGNTTTTSGIYDVRSGAEGTALDGSSYSEWE
jgi:general secretion pathway protein G